MNIQRIDAQTRPRASAGMLPLPREALVLGPIGDGGSTLVAGLARLGVSVRGIEYGDPALRARLMGSRPDLLVVSATTPALERTAQSSLDPVLDGLQALTVPVLAATGPTPTLGADLWLHVDDILLPPHDPAEAVLRAALAARRRGGSAGQLVSAGPLTVDIEGFRAWLSGEPISLTYTEFQLLRLLLLNRGKVLTRQMLLNKIWGYDYLGGLRTVDVHIRRLRAKVEAAAPHLIETVRHVGYRIAE